MPKCGYDGDRADDLMRRVFGTFFCICAVDGRLHRRWSADGPQPGERRHEQP
jgi:hypothetical protein